MASVSAFRNGGLAAARYGLHRLYRTRRATVSVIDTDKWTVTNRKGRSASRQINLRGMAIRTSAVGMTKDRGDRYRDPAGGTACPQVPIRSCSQDAAGKILYVANENDNTVTITIPENRVRLGDIEVGVERRHGISPMARSDQYVRDH